VFCRQLLFLDLNQVQAAHHTAALPPIIVVHHLFSRAYPFIPFPMTVFNWTEEQYSDWLDTHTESEAAPILNQCLESYVDDVRKRGEKEFRVEYPIIRTFISLMQQS
jgi:conserved oligomeric Golgi complex subunit 5